MSGHENDIPANDGAPEVDAAAEEAAFAQGASALRGETPAETNPAPAAKPEADTTKPENKEPPAGGTALDQVKTVAEQRTREERDRILNAEAERIAAENAARAAAGAAPLSDEQIVNAWRNEMKDEVLADPESADGKGTLTFAEFATRYPTVVDAMARTYLRQQKTMQSKLEQAVKPLSERLDAMDRERAADKFFGDLVALGHADARELANSEQLLTWAQAQDVGVQQLLDSADPKDVALVLSAFKEATGVGKPPPAPTPDAKAQARERLKNKFEQTRREATPPAPPRRTTLEASAPEQQPTEQEEAAAFERGAQTAPARPVRGMPRR